jgi:hypothetical protein
MCVLGAIEIIRAKLERAMVGGCDQQQIDAFNKASNHRCSACYIGRDFGAINFATNGVPPVTAVPEPSTWAMMLIGFAGLGFAFHRSRRKVSMA